MMARKRIERSQLEKPQAGQRREAAQPARSEAKPSGESQ
jgi:hypothetical protein